MTGVGQMACHVKAHDAQAYEGNLLGISIARIGAHGDPPSALND
jgi:hypothetical protein